MNVTGFLLSKTPCRHCGWKHVYANPGTDEHPSSTMEVCSLCGQVSLFGRKVWETGVPEMIRADLVQLRKQLNVPRESADDWTTEELAEALRILHAVVPGPVAGLELQCGSFRVLALALESLRLPLVRLKAGDDCEKIWAVLAKKISQIPDMLVIMEGAVPSFQQPACRERN